MMLLDPSPGQLVDRITILKLKIQHGSSVCTTGPTNAAQWEYAACYSKLTTHLSGVNLEDTQQFWKLFSQLEEQNLRQWRSEDAVRVALFNCQDPPTYEQLISVYREEKPNAEGNEIRARLVKDIDAIFNVIPEVKIYA